MNPGSKFILRRFAREAPPVHPPPPVDFRRPGHQASNLKPSAFTLIEIVLAIGIMSFALVGILGLFPVALETARDSKAETQVSLLAQQIEADLRSLQQSGTDGSGSAYWTTRIHNGPSGSNPSSAAAYQNLNLLAPTPTTVTLAYVRGNNLELVPKGTEVSTQYATGVAGAEFLARITTTYNTPNFPNLTTIEIRIEAPGSSPATARKSYDFFTLMGQR